MTNNFRPKPVDPLQRQDENLRTRRHGFHIDPGDIYVMRKFIRTTFTEYLKENNQLSGRIDNALDWMNKHDIRISDEKLQDYIDYTSKNFSRIENLVSHINANGYIWASDLPMFFTTSLGDLESGSIDVGDINIYRQGVEIHYKYTHVFNDPYEGATDKYAVIYKNETGRNTTDEISSEELIELSESGAIMTEHGVIGLSREKVRQLIQSALGYNE